MAAAFSLLLEARFASSTLETKVTGFFCNKRHIRGFCAYLGSIYYGGIREGEKHDFLKRVLVKICNLA